MLSEDYAIVLDYLPHGKSSDFKEEPLAQLLGETHFSLLEAVPLTVLKPLERAYIGKDKRDKIQLIKRRVNYDGLTSNAKNELANAIGSLISGNPEKFLDFFNSSGPISIKRHFLELLPGMGKKHLKQVLDERDKGKFTSFEDIRKRVPGMIDPVRLVTRRIIEEMGSPDEKHYLFARPPKTEKTGQFRKD